MASRKSCERTGAVIVDSIQDTLVPHPPLVELAQVSLAGIGKQRDDQRAFALALRDLPRHRGGGARRGTAEDSLGAGQLERRAIGRLVVAGDDLVDVVE